MTPTRHNEYSLLDALAELGREEAGRETPLHVAASVLAAWDHAHAESVRPPHRLWRDMAAVAAAIAMTVGLAQLGRELQRLTQPVAQDAQNSRTLLLVGEPILQGEPVRMVRMRVPTSALTGLGVRSVTGSPGEHIDVDLIVGEDGVARAIRVGR